MLPQVTATFVGPTTTGKSTIIGHLLLLTANISDKQLKNYKAWCDTGKPNDVFRFTANNLERRYDNTQIMNCKNLKSSKYDITLIDTPGLLNLKKSMIRGISCADIGLFVFSAIEGEYENTINITKMQSLISYTFGIRKIIVCINKMDCVNYCQIAFNELSGKIRQGFIKIGFNSKNIIMIPVSGTNGDNLIDNSVNMKWYKGNSLLHAINNIDFIDRPISYPFRMSVDRCDRILGIGTVVTGTVAYGNIIPSTITTILPSRIHTKAFSIESYHQTCDHATAGDNIGLNLRGVSKNNINTGDVIISGDIPPYDCESFIGQIITFKDAPKIMKIGYSPILYCHTTNSACKITKFISRIDKRTGEQIENNIEELKRFQSALVEFKPENNIWIETYDSFPKLGRFVLLDNNKLIGAGIVKEITTQIKGRKTKSAY